MKEKPIKKVFVLPDTSGAGSKGLFLFNKLHMHDQKNSCELSDLNDKEQ